MLEFVDSNLYFVQDKNNFYKSILIGRIRIRWKKVADPDPAGQKSPDPTGSGSSSLDMDHLSLF